MAVTKNGNYLIVNHPLTRYPRARTLASDGDTHTIRGEGLRRKSGVLVRG